MRAKPLRRRDLAGRRQFLRGGALAAGSYLTWELQRPLSAWVGLRGARRRFTGSYEARSFAGNAFPSTSWVTDSPRALPDDSYRLERAGRLGADGAGSDVLLDPGAVDGLLRESGFG